MLNRNPAGRGPRHTEARYTPSELGWRMGEGVLRVLLFLAALWLVFYVLGALQ